MPIEQHAVDLILRLSAIRPENTDDIGRLVVHAFEAAVKEERERCAKIADAHKGSAAKKRREKFGKLSSFGLDNGAEIETEERGEDIAAEMIARAIRAA